VKTGVYARKGDIAWAGTVMHWIKSVFVIVMMIVGAPGEAAHAPVAAGVAAGAASSPVVENGCETCRDALSECTIRACEPSGVFGAELATGPPPATRITNGSVSGVAGAGLDLQPVPPPPRG